MDTMSDKPTPHYAVQEAPPPADTTHIKRKFLNLAYAPISSAQKLDIYLPDDNDGPFPVILVVHGGAFMGCDKADLQVLPMLEGLKRGYAVVSINYRMSGEAQFPALVQDAKAAVRWIRANAAKYHFDPEKIAAWGGSAGGYLVTMLGVSAGVHELENLSLGNPEQPCHIQAVVAWYAPTNFLKMDEYLTESGLLPPPGFRHNEADSPESLLLGQIITAIPERVKAANPETYIRSAGPPFLLQHGTKDPVVPVQHSIAMAAKLEKAWGRDKVTLELFEGAEHADVRFETPENVARVLDFIDKHLKYV
jgi:acetyl esterase/lipase